jgi:hypothetical protein
MEADKAAMGTSQRIDGKTAELVRGSQQVSMLGCSREQHTEVSKLSETSFPLFVAATRATQGNPAFPQGLSNAVQQAHSKRVDLETSRHLW